MLSSCMCFERYRGMMMRVFKVTYFVVLCAGEKAFKACRHYLGDRDLDLFIYGDAFRGIFLFKRCSWGVTDQERGAFVEETARLVWEMVGEAPVPPT